MTPEEMRIDERQLDDALRTIAAVPAPEDLPSHALSVIEREAHGWWQPLWRPAIGVALGATLVALIAVWMQSPATPRAAHGSRLRAHGAEAPHSRTSAPIEAQGSGRTAQGADTAHLRTSASGEAQRSGRMAQGSEPANVRTIAPLDPRTPAPSALSAPAPLSEAEGVDEVPALDPPRPLTIARLETPELSERQLQMNALHVPALEIETLER